MLPTDHFDERVLTLLFDIDVPEQAEALRSFGLAFGTATDIEAIWKSIYALHIQPGYPGYPRDGGTRAPGGRLRGSHKEGGEAM